MAAAFSDEGGRYFNVTKEAPSSPLSRDEKMQTELWQYTEQIIKEAQAKRAS
jgi:hypothetical protein